jgi:hypothetical protein
MTGTEEKKKRGTDGKGKKINNAGARLNSTMEKERKYLYPIFQI